MFRMAALYVLERQISAAWRPKNFWCTADDAGGLNKPHAHADCAVHAAGDEVYQQIEVDMFRMAASVCSGAPEAWPGCAPAAVLATAISEASQGPTSPQISRRTAAQPSKHPVRPIPLVMLHWADLLLCLMQQCPQLLKAPLAIKPRTSLELSRAGTLCIPCSPMSRSCSLSYEAFRSH